MTNQPLYITQNTLWKIAYPEGYRIGGKEIGGKHNLGIEMIKQLPEQLADPMVITNNTEKHKLKTNDSIVVWTDWVLQNGRSVIIPITIDVHGRLTLANRVESVFDANPDYLNRLVQAGVLYARNGKDIGELLGERRQLPISNNSDVFCNIIADGSEEVKQNARSLQFQIIGSESTKFSSTDLIDPETDLYAAAAYRLYNDGITYEKYMTSDTADWRVGKVLNSLWNSFRKERVMQRALDLYENGISPVDYLEKNKLHFGQAGDQDL